MFNTDMFNIDVFNIDVFNIDKGKAVYIQKDVKVWNLYVARQCPLSYCYNWYW